MSQEQKNTTYEIVFDAADLPVHQVTAAYTNIDDRMYPGWVLLRDENGALVAKVRADRTLMIRRAEANPIGRTAMAASAPQVTITTTAGSGSGLSPAHVAALREHAAKAARV